MKLEHDLPQQRIEDAAKGVTDHITWIARTLMALGPDVASSLSTTQRVGPGEAETIRTLLPLVAKRHGLRARTEEGHGAITVTFERPVK